MFRRRLNKVISSDRERQTLTNFYERSRFFGLVNNVDTTPYESFENGPRQQKKAMQKHQECHLSNSPIRSEQSEEESQKQPNESTMKQLMLNFNGECQYMSINKDKNSNIFGAPQQQLQHSKKVKSIGYDAPAAQCMSFENNSRMNVFQSAQMSNGKHASH